MTRSVNSFHESKGVITIKPYLKSIGTKEKKILSEFKGLFTDFGREGCPAGFSPFMENISATDYPFIKTRQKRKEICSLSGEILFFGIIEGKYLSCVEKLGDGCTWKYFDGEWKDICAVPESDSGNYDMIYFLNATILVCGKKAVVGGIEKCKSYALTFEGSVAKAEEELSMPLCDMVETIDGRLAAAHSGGESIFLGGIMDRGVWFDIDDGLQQSIITQSCENISAIKTFGGHLVCFKEHAFGEIYGNTPDTYTCIMASESIGLIAPKTLCDCGRLLWLSDEGILSYGGGSLPKNISSGVKKYIDALDRDRLYSAAAGCDGERYIISLPQVGGGKINLVLNLESGTFAAEDGEDFRFFGNMDGVLYAAAANGKIYALWQEEGENFSWKWESGSIKAEDFRKSSMRRIYVDAECFGSIKIEVMAGDKTQVYEDKGEGRKIYALNLHPTLLYGKDRFTIRLSGEGECSVYKICALVRKRNISY